MTGLGLLIGGIIWLTSGLNFQNNAVEITGEIVDIFSYSDSDGDINHEVYVDYTYKGKDYEKM